MPSLLGVLLAIVFYALSLTPTLLPRRWWWQAFVSGTLMGLGYVFGWTLEEGGAALFHLLNVTFSAPPEVTAWATWVVIAAVVGWALRLMYLSYGECQTSAHMQGMKPVGPGEYLLASAASLLVFAFVMQVVYLIIRIFTLIVDLLENWVLTPIAVFIASVSIVMLVFFVSNKVVFKTGMAIFARKAAHLNTTSGDHYERPPMDERSGSASSLSPWETIGGQGRKYLTKGPTAARISSVTGRPAVEPIRIYVGMPRQNADLQKLADQAIAEMDRTGAFDRSVILIITATGSGWVDEWSVQPLEYLTGGDCAVVTMQYSYLFSAALVASGVEVCAEAGTILFEAVEKRVKAMAPEKRPLVIVSGESLGGYGSQDAFTDLDDLNARVDGALWVGSPHQSKLLRQLTDHRHKGSPQVAPVVDSGRHARFVNTPDQLDRDRYGRELGTWEFPRTVFVQHASDPVVFFYPRIAFEEPDWIRERAGVDVSSSIRFTPFATFMQMFTDLPVAGTAPEGHGHTYHRELVDVWMRILGFDHPVAQGRVGQTAWLTPQMKAAIGDAIDEDDSLDP